MGLAYFEQRWQIADVQVRSKDYMVLEGNHIIVFTSV